LDRWDEEGVGFVFGIDAMANLYDIVENLPDDAWRRLKRPARYEVKTTPRERPENIKEQIVIEREFKNIRLVDEYVAEFSYRPVACKKDYRVIVVWKDLEVSKGQAKLFDDSTCFFYITNDRTSTPEDIVFRANDRCDQENLIEQQKNGVHALTAPLDNQTSNWAYMVMASLAWSLKAWSALLVPVHGRWKEKHETEKNSLLKMDFVTFRNAMIAIPAQIIRSAGKIIYRLLAWNPWQPVFFRLVEQLRKPMRC
jgi:hypothetical protein